MRFIVDNIYTKVEYTHDEYNYFVALRNFLTLKQSVFAPGGYFRTFYRRYINKKNMIPTGLLNLVIDFCNKNEFNYEVIDKRNRLEIKPESLNNISLRDYQKNAVIKCLQIGRGIVKSPTGSGKTAIIASIINSFVKENRKVLVIVDRLNLMLQHREMYTKYGIDDKIISLNGGGYRYEPNKKVCITTIQSARELLNYYFDCVIVDECHKASSHIYREFLKRINSYYRFGFSATPYPEKDDVKKFNVISYLGEIIYEVGFDILVSESFINEPRIYFLKYSSNKNYDLTNRPYSEIYDLLIVKNHDRNYFISYVANKLKGKTIVFFKIIEHGKNIESIFKKYFHKQLFYIDGSINPVERKNIIDKFNSYDDNCVLLTSTIADEGIDFNNVHNLILAGGGNSEIKTLQRIGRGLRPTDVGVTNIIDIYDTHNKILLRHAKERMKLYKENNFKIVIFSSDVNNDKQQ
jgi:superfamily II DNA or RNA helicase